MKYDIKKIGEKWQDFTIFPQIFLSIFWGKMTHPKQKIDLVIKNQINL